MMHGIGLVCSHRFLGHSKLLEFLYRVSRVTSEM